MSQKKPKAKNLRNVLGIPFNIQWSESNPEGLASLQKALEELLPLAKLEKKSLKLHSKDGSKEKTQPGTPSAKKHNNVFRTYLAPGFQSVIRGLERNELCCVLMSSDISPPMIQRVVCSYCNTHDIPLMIAPELKIITKSALGFPTMVLGLKKIADSTENPFFQIYEIASMNRSVFETPFVAKQNKDIVPEKMNKSIFRNEPSCVSLAKSQDFYLYRKNTNERVFRPRVEVTSEAQSQVQHTSKLGMDGDFICFSKSETNSSEFEHMSRNSPKIGDKSDSQDDDSDCDSMDEDNIFFVDNKPDHMILDTDPSNNEENDCQTNAGIKRLNIKLLQNKETGNSSKKKTSNIGVRYFSGKITSFEEPNKIKNKEKKISKPKPKDSTKTQRKEKLTSSTFNPLTIKTIKTNPKKIRRKKK